MTHENNYVENDDYLDFCDLCLRIVRIDMLWYTGEMNENGSCEQICDTCNSDCQVVNTYN